MTKTEDVHDRTFGAKEEYLPHCILHMICENGCWRSLAFDAVSRKRELGQCTYGGHAKIYVSVPMNIGVATRSMVAETSELLEIAEC